MGGCHEMFRNTVEGFIYNRSNFTGNGVLYQFTLSVTPTSEDYTDVYISGVYQQKNTYTLSTATIDFGVSNPVPVTATNGIEVVSTT